MNVEILMDSAIIDVTPKNVIYLSTIKAKDTTGNGDLDFYSIEKKENNE